MRNVILLGTSSEEHKLYLDGTNPTPEKMYLDGTEPTPPGGSNSRRARKQTKRSMAPTWREQDYFCAVCRLPVTFSADNKPQCDGWKAASSGGLEGLFFPDNNTSNPHLVKSIKCDKTASFHGHSAKPHKKEGNLVVASTVPKLRSTMQT